MTNIELYAYEGFERFEKHYSFIFEQYKQRGQIFLENYLCEHEKEIKNICMTVNNYEEFLKELRSFWENNYQIIIDNCKDVEKAYNVMRKKLIGTLNISKRIYVGYNGGNEPLYVTESFLQKLVRHKNNYVFSNNCIYKIAYDFKLHEYIIIEEKIDISEALKDE